MNSSAEHALEGGNVAEMVVRVGSTVRKPAGDATTAVEALLDHFAHVGFSGAPRSLGRDELGRHVLEYVPGKMANTLPPLTASELRRLGALIHELHDAAESFKPPPMPQWKVVIAPDRKDQVCHHDLAPWNLVRDGDRWVFIDWDGAGPGSRLWDLAYAASTFIPLCAGGDPKLDGPRMRALVDGYGLDDRQRRALPALIAAHTRGMYDLLHSASLTGEQPWPACTPKATASTGARPPTTSRRTLIGGRPRSWNEALHYRRTVRVEDRPPDTGLGSDASSRRSAIGTVDGSQNTIAMPM